MEEIRIVISGDAKELKPTIDQLEKIGKVDKQNADQFKKHHEEHKKRLGESTNIAKQVKEHFNELATTIGAAFAVEKVIEFGAESIKAFEEAQKAAKELQFAIKSLAGGTDKDFKEMTEQSEKLAKSLNFLFTPKQFQEAQAQLLRMKFSTEQASIILPRIADIAAKTGKSLSEVSEAVGRAVSEGNTKGLTTFGLKFKDTGTMVGNFNKLMEKSKGFIGGAADALGDLANREQEAANKSELLKEKIGEKLAPIWVKLKNAVLQAGESITDFYTSLLKGDTTDLFQKYINALTLGLVHLETSVEATEKRMAEFRKMNTQQLIAAEAKLLERRQHGSQEEIINAAKVLQELSTVLDEKKAKHESTNESIKANEVDLTKMTLGELEKRLEYAKDEDRIIGDFTTSGFQKEEQRVQKEIDRRKKANDELKKLWEKYYNDLESIRKKDAEDANRAEISLLQDEYAKKLKVQQNNFDKEMVDLDDRQKKLLEIQKKGNAEEKELATKELKTLGELRIKLKLANDIELANISEAHFKEESDKAMKREIEKNELIYKQGEIEAKRAFVNKKITQEEYDKQLKGLQIEELEKKLAIEKSYGIEDIKLEQEIEEKKLDLKKESTKKQLQELGNQLQEASQYFFQFMTQQMDNNIALIDTQIQRQDKMIDVQRTLAEKGLKNDLAFEEKRADELTKKKMDEERKLKRIKEFETFLNSLAKFSEDDPKTALPKALGILAAARAAEAVFAEEGGIIGQTTGKSVIGLNGFSRRHRSGNDVLLHAEKGEGILSVHEMNNLGHQNFGILKNILKTPFHEKLIPNSRPMVISDHSEVVKRLESLEHTILNKKETHFDWVGYDMRITEIENGMKKITTHKRNMI